MEENAPRPSLLLRIASTTLRGVPLRALATNVASEVIRNNTFGRAAELSFFFLLSLFPLLLFLTSLFGIVLGESDELRGTMFTSLRTVLPAEAYELIHETILGITENASGSKLSFGLIATLVASSSGVSAIIDALNGSYGVRIDQPFWKTRLRALWLTVALSGFVVVALLVMLGGSHAVEWAASRLLLDGDLASLARVAQWPIVVVFVTISCALLYRFAPSIRGLRFRDLVPGVCFAVPAWLVSTFGIRVYLSYFNIYGATYGSLGAVIILMLWFYLTSLAILLGGELNAELSPARRKAPSVAASPPHDD